MAKKAASTVQPLDREGQDFTAVPDATEAPPGDVAAGDVAEAPAPARPARPTRRGRGPAPVPSEDAPKPPPFGTPVPAGKGPLPRLVSQLARAPEGLTRYKIRAANYGDQPVEYVLARDEESARECYLEATGLSGLVARLRKAAGPDLVVVELED